MSGAARTGETARAAQHGLSGRIRLGFAIAIAAAVGLFGLHLIRQHVADEGLYYQQAITAARDISGAAERVVLVARTRVELLSRLDSLRRGDLAAFDAQLRAVPHPKDSWFVVYERDGTMLVNTLRPFGTLDLPAMTAGRPDSKVILEQVVDGDRTLVGTLQWAPLAQSYAIVVTTSFAAEDGRRYGLLEATRQSVFGAIPSGAALPASWSGGIIDWNGRNIAGPGSPDGPAADAGLTQTVLEAATVHDEQHLLIRRNGLRIQEVVFHRSDATRWISFVRMERFDPILRLTMVVAALAMAGFVMACAADRGLLIARRELLVSMQGLTTALRTALNRHAVTERLLNKFWDRASDALFIVEPESDGTFRFEATNRAFLQFMRVSVTRRKPLLWSRLHESSAALLLGCLRHVPATGHTHRYLRELTVDGKTRTYEVRLSAGEGSVFGSIRDVTEIAQAKANLRRIGRQLLAAQDSERRRIARELHDSTTQLLAAASMRLAQALPSTALAADAIAEARQLIDRSQQELRTVTYLLHPPLLDELGITATLNWYSGRLARSTGITIDVTIDEKTRVIRLLPEVEVALFRVAQEALTNAIRHSGCSVVHITLGMSGGGLLLRILDDGRGLSHPIRMPDTTSMAVIDFGVGIYGMSERIRQLHGWLSIQPAHPRGTLVEAWIPEPDVASQMTE